MPMLLPFTAAGALWNFKQDGVTWRMTEDELKENGKVCSLLSLHDSTPQPIMDMRV